MQHTLIERLISRVEKANPYPSKHPKKERSPLKYAHVSNTFFEHKDPVTNVVSLRRIGHTYHKD